MEWYEATKFYYSWDSDTKIHQKQKQTVSSGIFDANGDRHKSKVPNKRSILWYYVC